jgi:hypothetical protein
MKQGLFPCFIIFNAITNRKGSHFRLIFLTFPENLKVKLQLIDLF